MTRQAIHAQLPPAGLGAQVRRANVGRILTTVHAQAPITRGRLVELSGLNRVTVLDIVAELQSQHLVQETQLVSTGRSGRPARALELDDRHLGVAILQIGPNHISLRCASLRGRTVVTAESAMCSRDPGRVIDAAVRLLDRAARQLALDGRTLRQVSIGVPAFIDQERRSIVEASALGWRDVPLVDMMEKRFGSHVSYSLDRLASLAITAERSAAGYPVSEGVLLLFGSHGIGGAYQKDGMLLTGDHGTASEFGHLSVDFEGRDCFCGARGCLETYVGVGPLADQLGIERDSAGQQSQLVSTVLARVAQGGAEIQHALAEQGRWLGRAISTLQRIYDPGVIILGGYLPPLAPGMLPALQAELDARSTTNPGVAPVVRISPLGVDAVLEGGVQLSIQRLLTDESGQLAIDKTRP